MANSLDKIMALASTRRRVRRMSREGRPLTGTALAARFIRWARQVRLGHGEYANWSKLERIL